jgi:hypothetical protein
MGCVVTPRSMTHRAYYECTSSRRPGVDGAPRQHRLGAAERSGRAGGGKRDGARPGRVSGWGAAPASVSPMCDAGCVCDRADGRLCDRLGRRKGVKKEEDAVQRMPPIRPWECWGQVSIARAATDLRRNCTPGSQGSRSSAVCGRCGRRSSPRRWLRSGASKG